MRRSLYLFAALMVLCGAGDVRGEMFRNRRYSASVTVGATYDANLFRYSNRDRNAFIDRTEFSLSPFRTLDDIRTDLKITGAMRFSAFGKRDGRVQATVNYASHAVNSMKNLGWISLTGRQEVSPAFSVFANYFYEPYYYIREYFDAHQQVRRGCDFSLEKLEGRVYYRPAQQYEFVGIGLLKHYYYNRYFTEYDSDYSEFGGEVVIRTRGFRVAAGYSLAVNDNIGFHEELTAASGVIDEDTEVGNSDYEEDNYTLSVRHYLRMFNRRGSINLELSLADRYYSTDRPPELDPIHHGRRDLNFGAELSATLRVNRRVDIEAVWEFGSRDTRSSDSVVQRVKNYFRQAVGAELKYDIW